MRPIFVVFASLLISYTICGQPPGGVANRPANGRSGLTGTFFGRILEDKSSRPIEYASVTLLQTKLDTTTKKRTEVVVGGMLTRANGDFLLENVPVTGSLKLRITVIGYQPHEQAVSFDRPSGDGSGGMPSLDKDLGNIRINIEEKTLENVTLTVEKSGLQLGIDRKIFNVDKNLVSAGGTAVDVMKNVPSVSVDIDGNVTMRNNSPQIFVDGRPTTMTLDQIPADAIESVEIITNPSAKFDASGGTSGILNVVLKKAKRVGYSGSVRTNIDSRGRFGLSGDINVRQDKINFFLNANMNQRKSISTGSTDRLTLGTNPNIFTQQDDRTVQAGSFMFFRAGFDYFLDNRNTISLTGNIGRGRFKPYTESDILIDSLYPQTSSLFIDRFANSISKFNNSGAMLSFKHNFPKQGEEFTADINFNRSRTSNTSIVTNDSLSVPGYSLIDSYRQEQQGRGANQNITFQADYAKPLNEKSKFEIGVRAQIRKVENQNDFYLFDPGAKYDPTRSVNYNSTDNVYAAYATYSNRIKGFGYQLGLRAESSDYQGRLPDKNQVFDIQYPVSLFPSVFLTQKITDNQDLQLNYSRRINRPNFWQLNPQADYTDALNISVGNPNLKPEFTNSLELSYQKTFTNRDNFIASLYYKNTNNLITRFLTRDTDPVSGEFIYTNTYINANSSYITGLELVSKNKITKWWDLTSNLNLFTSKIDIDDPSQTDQDQFASWFAKMNNTFKLPKNFTFQLSGEYQSKTVLAPGGGGERGGGERGGGGFGGGFGHSNTSQGFSRANYYVDAGIRFEFLKNRQASLSLSVNDIFRTRRINTYSESQFLIQNVFRRRDPQIFRLNFNWKFGKFDANLFKRKNNRNPGGDGTENMNMGM